MSFFGGLKYAINRQSTIRKSDGLIENLTGIIYKEKHPEIYLKANEFAQENDYLELRTPGVFEGGPLNEWENAMLQLAAMSMHFKPRDNWNARICANAAATISAAHADRLRSSVEVLVAPMLKSAIQSNEELSSTEKPVDQSTLRKVICCTHCASQLRVPINKNLIVTCPRCNKDFQHDGTEENSFLDKRDV